MGKDAPVYIVRFSYAFASTSMPTNLTLRQGTVPSHQNISCSAPVQNITGSLMKFRTVTVSPVWLFQQHYIMYVTLRHRVRAEAPFPQLVEGWWSWFWWRRIARNSCLGAERDCGYSRRASHHIRYLCTNLSELRGLPSIM